MLVASGSHLGAQEGSAEGRGESEAVQDQPYPLTEEAVPSVGREPEEAQSLVAILLKLAVTLFGVLGLIVGMGWIARKFVPGAQAIQGSGPIKVLTRVTLGPKANLLLIQIGRRILVVGQTGESLQTLAEISDPNELQNVMAQIADSGWERTKTGFRSIFRRNLEEYEEDLDDPEGAGDVEALQKAREELRRLD